MSSINLKEIRLRLATDKDLPAIINLLADDELGKTRETSILSKQIPECYTNAYNRIKNDPNHMLVVIDYNREVVGTLQFIIIPTLTLQGCIRAEVEGVRIKPAYQKLGLGRILFDWVKETAIAHGCGLIQLATNKKRDAAQRFYKSVGFIDSHCGMKIMLK